MTLHYADGQFSEGPDWVEAVWALAPENDDEAAYAKAGYEPYNEIGVEFALKVRIYRRESGQRSDPFPPWFIMIWDGANRAEFISAATFTDVMDLLARWAPVVTAAAVSYAVNAVFGDDTYLLADLLATIRADEHDGTIKRRMAAELERREQDRRRRAAP